MNRLEDKSLSPMMHFKNYELNSMSAGCDQFLNKVRKKEFMVENELIE